MGAKGIRIVSESVSRSHPGQVAGSLRKKKKRAQARTEREAKAAALGIDVATLRKRGQEEVGKLPSDWLRQFKSSAPPVAYRPSYSGYY
jgi:hypothetical protein